VDWGDMQHLALLRMWSLQENRDLGAPCSHARLNWLGWLKQCALSRSCMAGRWQKGYQERLATSQTEKPGSEGRLSWWDISPDLLPLARQAEPARQAETLSQLRLRPRRSAPARLILLLLDWHN